jgi:hypothetical protein
MDQLAVDIQERRIVLVADDVFVPEFVVESRSAHGWPQTKKAEPGSIDARVHKDNPRDIRGVVR